MGSLRTGNTTPTGAELLEQAERVLASQSFSGSDSMRNLLRYLAEQTVASPDHPPKEYEIAVKVLGRSEDFDSRVDPAARVTTSRLRSKLAEYYVSEGAGDRVYLEVPKGSYCIVPSYRHMEEGVVAEARPAGRRRWMGAAGVAALTLLAGFTYWGLRAPEDEKLMRQLWGPFLNGGGEPLVVFANPKFVGSSPSGLRLYEAERDLGATINPSYTGAGEVISVHELTKLFLRFGRTMRLKRSQLFTWDDAKAYNVIFLGGGPHTMPMFQHPIGRRFQFKPFNEEPRRGEGCVQDLRPEAGKPALYCGSIAGEEQLEYSLVSMAPGADPAHTVLWFAGQTTFGTAAAVEFFSDTARAAQVQRQLGAGGGTRFEAMLRCKMRAGASVETELVLVAR